MSALPLPPFAACAKVSPPAQADGTFLSLQPMLKVWLIDLIRHHASSDSVLDFFTDRRHGGCCDEIFGKGFSEQVLAPDESPLPCRHLGGRGLQGRRLLAALLARPGALRDPAQARPCRAVRAV